MMMREANAREITKQTLQEGKFYQPLSDSFTAQDVSLKVVEQRPQSLSMSTEANTLYYQRKPGGRVAYTARAYNNSIKNEIDLCDVFLVGAPEREDSCLTSDSKHLYLYQRGNGEFFYYIEVGNEHTAEEKQISSAKYGDLHQSLTNCARSFLNNPGNSSKTFRPIQNNEKLQSKILEIAQTEGMQLDSKNFTEQEILASIARDNPLLSHVSLPSVKKFYQLNIPGHGDCGPISVANHLIHAVQSGKLKVDALEPLVEALQMDEVKTWLKNIAGFFKTGTGPSTTILQLPELAPALYEFIEFVERNPTQKNIHQYFMDANSQTAIAALAMGLAPALRKIGVQALQNNESALNLVQEGAFGEHASDELIQAICAVFNMRCIFVTANSDNEREKTLTVTGVRIEVGHLADPDNAYNAYIAKKPGHFNPLFPESELNSTFAKNLAKNSNEPAVQQNHRKHLLSAHMHDDSFDTSNNSLTQRSVSNLSNLSSRLQQAISEKKIERSVKVGTETIDLVSLVKNCQSSSGNDDEPLAKCLQLEEIDIFLNAHCDTLMHKSEAKHQDVEDKKTDFISTIFSHT